MAAGNAVSVLDFAGSLGGYVTFGRARNRSDLYPFQIYELYLKPEFQGLGFGRRLFGAARSTFSSGGKRARIASGRWPATSVRSAFTAPSAARRSAGAASGSGGYLRDVGPLVSIDGGACRAP